MYLASLRRWVPITWFKCTKLAGPTCASVNFTANENLLVLRLISQLTNCLNTRPSLCGYVYFLLACQEHSATFNLQIIPCIIKVALEKLLNGNKKKICTVTTQTRAYKETYREVRRTHLHTHTQCTTSLAASRPASRHELPKEQKIISM